jgi:hypothetical protein
VTQTYEATLQQHNSKECQAKSHHQQQQLGHDSCPLHHQMMQQDVLSMGCLVHIDLQAQLNPHGK